MLSTSPLPLIDRAGILLKTPTAPFREHWMCAALDEMLARIPGLDVAADRFGNRIVRLRQGVSPPGGAPPPSREAAVFVAHLDHPGFVFPAGTGAQPQQGNFRRYQALFEGRVMDDYFPGAPVRLYRGAEDTGVRGRIIEAPAPASLADARIVSIETEEDASGAVLGMWDVREFETTADGILIGRACDDLAGCAAILNALDHLAHSQAKEDDLLDVCAIFSRAEEAGFCGSLCLMGETPLHPLLPENPLFVSVETSGEANGIELGAGAIIRAGDKSSTFDGRIVDATWSAARRSPNLRVRRALMDRGTCEATVFARAGYRAAGVCVPVRHYHNMNQQTKRIEAEQVAVGDLEALSGLMQELARAISRSDWGESVLAPSLFDALLQKGREQLEEIPLRLKAMGAEGME